ncbi:hypothetical protein ACO22_06929 [Paracoccidioides brasiliensis]|uniref:UBX domain-containing protein 2 n=1 Tax=Paracoccidioides brasiliensis TaxID=121759 RepID=A0A1D2J628_PARBR|nr:hypothetical protein ACO22_06929 [Paracoccidioides brasiliensis]
MFYEGDLQSGIALAVSEAKHVICLVKDEADESSKWENEYLADEEISSLMKKTAISLRLQEGSVEAGYLASFCPINKVPTLVVIKSGALREYLVSGIDGGDFKRRLKKALEDTSPQAPIPAPAPQVVPNPPQMDNKSPPAENTLSSSSPITTHASDDDSEATEEQRTAERTRRAIIRAGKRRAEMVSDVEPQQPLPVTESQAQSWKLEQRKRQLEKNEERDHILNQIRLDNEERKRQESRRESMTSTRSENSPPTPVANPQPQRISNQFRLQIRLFDGSSVRSSFSPTQTIQHDVRPWLDNQRSDGNAPYNLKQILTPFPSRNISDSEEHQTLEELGLGPASNLVMVPVRSYTDAYSSVGLSLPVRGLYAGYTLVSSTVGAVAGAIRSLLGLSQGPVGDASAVVDESRTPEAPAGTGFQPGRSNGRSNVRTLYGNDDNGKQHQFYNGNQVLYILVFGFAFLHAGCLFYNNMVKNADSPRSPCSPQLNFEPRKDEHQD